GLAVAFACQTVNRPMADDSFLARPAIADSQLNQLRRLLTALLPANAFYTKKISQAGVPATAASLHEFSEKFPFTTKQDIDEDQRAHPPYGTNLTFPLDCYTRFHQTSGTTGATIRCCTPTYALRLAEAAAEEKIDLRAARVKTIIVAGEPGGSIPALRTRLQDLWHGARVFDHHGLTETGPVTHECPRQPGVLHVLEPAYFAEVIEPASGQPLAAGQTGELVLTTLGRIGSPLLRYRTGDLVKLAPRTAERGTPCACGRHTLALEGGVLGRVDDLIIVRGVNIFPSAVEDIIRAC